MTSGGLVDLHSHSRASDGDLKPAELAARAREIGLAALALTDHDTVEGLEEFLAAGKALGLKALGGVEISLEHRGAFHLLGYDVLDGGGIPAALGELQKYRDERNRRMFNRLKALGYELSWERLLELSDGGQLGRPHFAAHLVERAYFDDRAQVFEELLAKGRPGYVDKIRLSQAEGLAMLRAAGWAPVLAHPSSLGLAAEDWPAFLAGLADQGLAGLEVYHPRLSPDESRFFQSLARRFKLAVTAGSDFHGDYNPEAGLNWVRQHSALGWEMVEELAGKLQTAANFRKGGPD
ncbi:MAG: PHP domain-containing protein [Candidatus Adiutrix sp.]|jgi:predicted metal-dependent phosphoesterase TrpH|nr:PHP domain-containing protein [Candidatus Adiutrix sp.]